MTNSSILFSVLVSTLLNGAVSSAETKQVLVLSGGGSPSGNHYSQYLQTKTAFENLKGRLDYPVELMFGAGHTTGALATYADVHKTENVEGVKISKWLVGAIENNQPATKKNVNNYFEKTLPKNLDTFFLLVSDHGMPFYNNGVPDRTFSNNCIDLWSVGIQAGEIAELGGFADARCLSKNELNSLIRKIAQPKKTVFAMSQCFSGGFHQMAVQGTVIPTVKAGICGFTAITHDTVASGCSPDVDGPSYQGYERSFTEQLTGYDYVNKKKLRESRQSFKAAHEKAILEDLTIDIPLATSDYYLWQWSNQLKGSQEFENATYFEVSGNASKQLQERTGLFLAMQNAIMAKYPDLGHLMGSDIDHLDQYVQQYLGRIEQKEMQVGQIDQQSSQIFNEVAFSMWIQGLTQGQSVGLTPEELKLEMYFQKISQETKMSAGRYLKAKLLPIWWRTDVSKAQAVSVYLAKRMDKIVEFASASGDAKVQAALNKMSLLNEQSEKMWNEIDVDNKKHGLLRRMLIYRQVLGAWAALEAKKNTTALAELNELLSCEETGL